MKIGYISMTMMANKSPTKCGRILRMGDISIFINGEPAPLDWSIQALHDEEGWIEYVEKINGVSKNFFLRCDVEVTLKNHDA